MTDILNQFLRDIPSPVQSPICSPLPPRIPMTAIPAAALPHYALIAHYVGSGKRNINLPSQS